MTNRVRGEEALRLKDGREFTLVLDFEAMVAAESSYGQPIGVLLQHWSSGFLGAMRCMLFGALRSNHADLSLEDAGAIVEADAEAVNKALAAVETGSRAKTTEDKKPGNRRRGKTSGRNGAKRG